MLTKNKFIDDTKTKRSVVPIRFVRACRAGHIGDIDWYNFVHGGKTDCRRPLWIEERGTTGDLSEVWVAVNVARASGTCSKHRSNESRRLANAMEIYLGWGHAPRKRAVNRIGC
jgi:hypothetical protein